MKCLPESTTMLPVVEPSPTLLMQASVLPSGDHAPGKISLASAKKENGGRNGKPEAFRTSGGEAAS
jgi:hypothetical protein